MVNFWAILLLVYLNLKPTAGVCYDQSPFWFTSQPSVQSLLDDQNEIISDRMRVKWGAMHNFKCVDYFQVISYLGLSYTFFVVL